MERRNGFGDVRRGLNVGGGADTGGCSVLGTFLSLAAVLLCALAPLHSGRYVSGLLVSLWSVCCGFTWLCLGMGGRLEIEGLDVIGGSEGEGGKYSLFFRGAVARIIVLPGGGWRAVMYAA